MAVGTFFSRLTGFARLAALGYALGVNPLADAYNLANQTPNIVHDLVIGGVLAATAVPVFVSRLDTEDQERAWEGISAVVTLSVITLAVATVALVVAAPAVVRLYTLGSDASYLAPQRSAATLLLRLFAPQVACYGLISLLTAVLNARRRFAAPTFAPIANNLVVIAVLVAAHALYGHPGVVAAAHDTTLLILLGLGTTAGVAVQALVLAPGLSRAVPRLRPALRDPDPAVGDVWARLEALDPGRARLALRWRFEPNHEAVRTILRLSGWTLGFVMANQVALFVVTHLADLAGPGALSAYTYAYIFFQLPFGIVAVSVMSAVQPDLARRWTLGDVGGFGRRAGAGLRAVVVATVPPAAGYLVLAGPLAALVLAHGAGGPGGARTTAHVLMAMAVGLPGFCAYLFLTSAFQAMQDTRTVFFLYLVENGLNLVLAFALAPFLGVAGLGLALSGAYTAAAVVAWAALRGRARAQLGGAARPARISDTGQLYLEVPGPTRSALSSLAAASAMDQPGRDPATVSLGRALFRVCGLSLVMAAAVAAVVSHVGSGQGWGLAIRVVVAVVVGVSVFLGGAALASTRGRDGRGHHEQGNGRRPGT